MALAYIIELFPFLGLWNFDQGFCISANNYLPSIFLPPFIVFTVFIQHKSKVIVETTYST